MDLQQETVTAVAVAVLPRQDFQMFLEQIMPQAVVLDCHTMALHILQAVALELGLHLTLLVTLEMVEMLPLHH
jgi:hypothetical protein